MDTTKTKSAPRNGTPSTPHAKYKRFPAYGKQMMEQRLAEQAPQNSVVVAFDWDIGKAFPRIVIPDDLTPDQIELRYLAGLDVMLTYRDKDASRVMNLAEEILQVNPRSLLAFAIDRQKNIIVKNLAGEVLL